MNPSDKYEQIKDIKRLNPVELEAMVLKHEQQIKDIAAHLLELKTLVAPMMGFKQDAAAKTDYEQGFDDGFILRKEKDGNRTWVGLTDDEINKEVKEKFVDYNFMSGFLSGASFAEAKLKEKNGG